MDIVRITDGIGNQLFQYAFAKAYSVRTGKKVGLDIRFINNEKLPLRSADVFARQNSRREYALDRFNISLGVASKAELKHWDYLYSFDSKSEMIQYLSKIDLWPYVYINKNNSHRISKFFPAYYEGNFFDLKYYEDIRSVLCKEISLKTEPTIPSELEEVFAQKTVAVHIRRSDFEKRGRIISETEYYKKAKQLICDRVEKPVFLLFSDDSEWIERHLNLFGDNAINIEKYGFADYEELMLMKKCKSFIIANSTFSYWAAYLCMEVNKVVVYPSKWRPQIIPKDWVECNL